MIRSLLLSGVLAAAVALSGCVTQNNAPAVAESHRLVEDGREAVRQGHLTEGGRLFTQAVKANPENAEAFYERGRCAIQMRLDPKTPGDSRAYEERAVDDFSTAIRKNPAYADAYFNRAMILSSRAQYKPAVDDLLNAARFKPSDPEAHLCLGELYESKFEDRMILAMDHYEKYVDLGGLDPSVREKVRIWKDLKKQVGGPLPAPSSKAPTPDEEKKAAELHLKALELLKQPDKTEAVKVMEELLTNYGHTKYVQEKARALQAAVAAFKKKDAPK
ncbi:MAG TPA: tetratricopeptide repeat protein [Planctomycetota bacterium]|nr:tetratricopeptide repeat protein [Planctomycetota bacterium]